MASFFFDVVLTGVVRVTADDEQDALAKLASTGASPIDRPLDAGVQLTEASVVTSPTLYEIGDGR